MQRSGEEPDGSPTEAPVDPPAWAMLGWKFSESLCCKSLLGKPDGDLKRVKRCESCRRHETTLLCDFGKEYFDWRGRNISCFGRRAGADRKLHIGAPTCLSSDVISSHFAGAGAHVTERKHKQQDLLNLRTR